MTAKQFISYIENIKVRRKINKIVFHHTSSPIESWQNSGSMLHYWNLYRSRGWKYGPHFFIAPNGIWLFSPITKQGKGAPGEGDKNSIHIEVVGRYFVKAPDNPELCFYLALATKLLMDKFNLEGKDLKNHLQYDPYAHETPFLNRGRILFMIEENKNVINKMILSHKKYETTNHAS